MTRLPASTIITITCNAIHQPTALVWGRQRFVVERITDAWRIETGWWTPDQHVVRHYFALTTTSGVPFVIFYDFLTQQWFLEQAYD